jgi:Fe-S cluster biosynthesis and repair protein YggX
MPQKSIAALLEKLGVELPKTESHGAPEAKEVLGPDAITDKRTGMAQNRLDGPPMKGKVGEYIAAHFGQATWREWIGMGTKVINELRLDFSNTRHQENYEEQMLQWLGVTMEEIDAWAAAKK